MQDLPENLDSKFRFVLLAAHRAEQMMRGARPKLDMPGEKITRIAMEEILQEAVEWGYGTADPEGTSDDSSAGEDEATAS